MKMSPTIIYLVFDLLEKRRRLSTKYCAFATVVVS